MPYLDHRNEGWQRRNINKKESELTNKWKYRLLQRMNKWMKECPRLFKMKGWICQWMGACIELIDELPSECQCS